MSFVGDRCLLGHRDECEIPEELNAAQVLQRIKLTRILEDIVDWSAENPEPSVVVLVLGDLGDVGAYIAEVMRLLKIQKNYEFMVVYPPPRPTLTAVRIFRSIPRGGL
ncbi:hypothetical protein Bca52824_080098 [Brassica carinata]|uniref:Uncharacterized protein n=1 Tax=Brassica carinata TaxID=52824 RepID=A0A8X7U0Q6_BRACI|nr:hypothetical protein Bca52824_080098 [Brassica carinata]